jgi:homocysteine S-methyltransferase
VVGFLIADGGLATELERRGLDLNDKLWSAKILIENPTAISEVPLHFIDLACHCSIYFTSMHY